MNHRFFPSKHKGTKELGRGVGEARRAMFVALYLSVFAFRISRKSRLVLDRSNFPPRGLESIRGWVCRVNVRLLSGFARTIRCCANLVARGVNAEFTSAAVRNDLARDGSW